MASPAAEACKPHVLLIPYPAQGHVNPFLRLAKALHARSFHVTFVHTEYNHARLLRSRGAAAVAGADGLRFETIPDGLPPPTPPELDATQDTWAICEATRRTGPAHVRELVERLGRRAGPPVSCVVADGAMGFAVHVAKEMGIPAYLFFTHSACGLLAYLNFDQLVKRGYVPLKVHSKGPTGPVLAAVCFPKLSSHARGCTVPEDTPDIQDGCWMVQALTSLCTSTTRRCPRRDLSALDGSYTCETDQGT